MIQRPVIRGMGRFSLIWLGQTISIVGSRTSAFAIGVSLFLATGSVTRYSLIALSIAVPFILFSPIAGVMADRYDRRHILLLSTLGTALGSLGLLRVVQSGGLESWHVYALLALKAACNAFAWPTFIAATTLIVGKRHLARASGMNNMGFSLGQILGPLLGGILLTPFGLETIILIDVATFLVPIGVLLSVRFPQPGAMQPDAAEPDAARPDAARPDAAEPDAARPPRERPEKRLDPLLGWRYLRERPGLTRLLLLTAGLQFSLGFAQVLFAPLVLSFSTPAVLGIVLSVSASGMLVGGLFISLWGGPAPARRVTMILIAMLAEGLLLMLAGLQPSVVLIASAAFFFMFAIPMISGANQATWQSKVPPALQGRVFAVRSIVQGGAAPLAIAAAGPLSDNVFEPLLAVGGPLADSVGRVVGVGPGRGIGLLLVVIGLGLASLAVLASRSRRLRRLEQEIADAEGLDAGLAPEPVAGAGEQDLGQGALPHLTSAPAAVLGLVMVLAAAWAILSQRPPAAVDASAPAAEFSAERALRHLEVIAKEPHPTGSAAHRKVAEYLVAQLEELGLETHVQRTIRVMPTPRLTRVAAVANVVARLPGSGPRPEGRGTVLLAAHYDSVPSSPGASDNGTAVAALLETARALVAAPPRHDLILLFADAEELGLLGARAFVREHPWADEVAVVINFDARGNGGPVYMFETGDNNGWWIPQLAAGAPRPVANSLMTQIYRLLPNATDFTIFRSAGYAGFNLASIEGLTHYHTMLDRPSDLDPDTVQHQGSYALGLARHLSSVDLEPEAFAEDGADRAYFNLPGLFVHYPPALAAVSAVLAVAAFLTLLRLGLRRRQLSPLGIFQGFLALFGMMAVLILGITLLWSVVRTIAGVPVVMGSTGGAGRYMIAFASLAVAGFAVLYRFFRRIASPLNLAMGALVWWLILVVVTSGPWLPLAGNFLFVWPLLFSAAGLAYLLLAPAGRRPWPTAAVLALTALPAILLLAPFIGLLYVGLQSLFELGGAALAPLVLLLGLLIPQLEAMAGHRPRRLPMLAAGFGAVMLVTAAANPGGPESQNSVLYAMDADTGEHHWFTLDRKLDPWVRQFGFEPGVLGPFRHFFPLVRGDLQRADAPAVELPAPDLEVLEHRSNGRVEIYRLRLVAAAGSQVRAIWFEPAEAVISAELGGHSIALAVGDGRIPLIQQIPPAWPEEEMTLRVRHRAPQVTVHLSEQLEGLPRVPGIEPRPADMIARPLFIMVRSDVTLIKRSLLLPAALAVPSSGE